MALDFPNAPTVGQVYTSGGQSWTWDGSVWMVSSPPPNPGVYLPLTGGTMTGQIAGAPGPPTLAAHLTRKDYVDNIGALFLPKTGGTLTGALAINAASPTLTMTDTDGANGANMQTALSFYDMNALVMAQLGFLNDQLVHLRAQRTNLVLEADTSAASAASIISMKVGNIEVGRVEPADMVLTGPTLMTMAKSDARYVNMGYTLGNDLTSMPITGFKHQARVVSDTNIILATAGLPIIDGYQTVAGDRVLLVGQTAKTENGIYTAAAGAWARSLDANQADMLKASVVTVKWGSLYGATTWQTTFQGNQILGTTNINWFQLARTDANTFIGQQKIAYVNPFLTINDTDADYTAGPVAPFVSAYIRFEAAGVINGFVGFNSVGNKLTLRNYTGTTIIGADLNNVNSANTIQFEIHNTILAQIDNDGGASVATSLLTRGSGDLRYLKSDGTADLTSMPLTGFKHFCAVAATGNTALTGLSTVDGVSAFVGQRILLAYQTDPIENGIWLASTGAWTRPPDAATGNNLWGSIVTVFRGTVNGGTQWACTTKFNSVTGTNAFKFVQLLRSDSTLHASNLDISPFSNINPDFNMVDPDFWASSTGAAYSFLATPTVPLSRRYISIPANAAVMRVEGDWFTVDPSSEYMISAAAWMQPGAVGGGTMTVYAETASDDGNGVATSLGLTVVQTKTDAAFGAVASFASISLVTPSAARLMRFVGERAAGGTALGRFGALKVQKVGDFGLGTQTPVIITNIDDPTLPDGFYALDTNAIVSGTLPPTGGRYNTLLVLHMSTLYVAQLVVNSGGTVSRWYANGVWGAWLKAHVDGGKGLFADGTYASPAIAFSADTNTGINHFAGAPGIIDVVTLGTMNTRFDASTMYRGGTVAPVGLPVSANAVSSGQNTQSNVVQWRQDNSTTGPYLLLAKSRDAVYRILGVNDELGTISFSGADGIQLQQGAKIAAYTDGAPTAGFSSGKLTFWTSTSTGAITERMRISGSGTVGIGLGAANAAAMLEVAGPVRVGRFTKATMPVAAAAGSGALCYVTDGLGAGQALVVSNGAGWYIAGTSTPLS